MGTPLLEACVGSYASALAASRGGADRLELCANLVIGGTTPSEALFSQVKRDCATKINVLIRPRFGDFLYDAMELDEMCQQIASFRRLGANGVVIGALKADGSLDKDALQRMLEQAQGMEVTLHRAFDMTLDPFESLETAISLGFTTILSSGQAQSAMEGAGLLKKLQTLAGDRISIMAGSGVKSGNITDLHAATGIRAFHASGKKIIDSSMTYRQAGVSMGLPGLSEYELWQTDEEEIRRCAAAVQGLRK